MPQATLKMRRYSSSVSTPVWLGLLRDSVKASAFTGPCGVWQVSQRGSYTPSIISRAHRR
jgi:hypothetical protein